MASCLPLTVIRASNRKSILCEDHVSDRNGDRDFQESGQEEALLPSLSVPKKLFRSVSLKLRKLNLIFDGESDGMVNEETRAMVEQGKERWASSNCLGLYAKSGRCRVGDDIGEDMEGRDNRARKKVVVADDSTAFNADREGDSRSGTLTLHAAFERSNEWNRKDSKCDNLCKSIHKENMTDMEGADGSVPSSLHVGDWTEKRERGRLECFAYGGTEMFWRRNSKKSAERRSVLSSNEERHLSLPDDIIEMCLARASLISLMNARLVCRKWRMLTTTTRFMQMRAACLSQKPWLFLFGLSRDGVCIGQIQALDTSMDKWYRIDADILRGRFMFSVAGAGSFVYVIGGCSTSNNSGKIDKTSYKTLKAVYVYSPLIGSWKKIAPMKTARALPVVGIFEVHCGSKGLSRHSRMSDSSRFEEEEHEEERDNGSKLSSIQGRYGGVASCSTSSSSELQWNRCSEVYGGLQNGSSTQQLWEALRETKSSGTPGTLPCSSTPDLGNVACGKFSEEGRDQYKLRETKAFSLIVAGGQGLWNEPLDSAEIYDPVSNKWREIARLPVDHGIVCAGVVCNGIFYVYSDSDKLAAYDLEKGRWVGIQITHAPVRLPEYFPKLVSCRGRLFMLCVSWCEREDGENRRDKATRKLWELDLSSYSWIEISRHPDAPLDWNASFVGNVDQIYGVEMFKIFGQVLDFVTACDVSGPTVKWSHISRKHVAQDVDASSCMTKAAVVVQL